MVMDVTPEQPVDAGPLSAIEQDAYCLSCGYNLRGLVQNRCPECGNEFDRAKVTASQLPWAYRRHIGRLRAYWKTVGMVMFRPERFCRERAYPVSYSDAQRFRWISVLHIYLTVVLVSIFWPDMLWVSDLWLAAALYLSVFLILAAITGVPSYFFHPRSLPIEQQNRAVALSYYCCAPLAWTPGLFLVGFLLGGIRVEAGAAVALAGGLLLQVIPWWWYLVKLSRCIMPEGSRRPVVTAVAVPILWIILTALIFLAVYTLFIFLGLVYHSLQP